MKNRNFGLVMLVGASLLLVSQGALAADGDELGNGVCALVKVLTGKWLFGFTILATLGAGAALLFGGEITDGLKKIATIISIVGIILATSSLLTMVFSGSSLIAC
jgi:type IV secretory pathway VirB2 component (pilin)